MTFISGNLQLMLCSSFIHIYQVVSTLNISVIKVTYYRSCRCGDMLFPKKTTLKIGFENQSLHTTINTF